MNAIEVLSLQGINAFVVMNGAIEIYMIANRKILQNKHLLFYKSSSITPHYKSGGKLYIASNYLSS